MEKEPEENLPFVKQANRIDEKALLNWLYPARKTRQVKSVSTPNAPTRKLCEIDNNLVSILKDILAKREWLLTKNRLLWYIIEIQLISGCRISEVLAINPQDISLSGHVVIRGKKGSTNKTIYVSDSRAYLAQCKELRIRPFKDFDRFFVYRQYKKLGIYFTFEDKSKSSVTHFFRQCNARLLEASEIDLNSIQGFLSHKSESSTSYYVKEKTGGSTAKERGGRPNKRKGK